MSLVAALLAIAPFALAQSLTPVLGVSSIAGTGAAGDSGDGGPAVNAAITSNYGMAVDKAGNVYFSDGTNAVVRKIDPSGVVTTIAGTAGTSGYSGDGGPATSAQLNPTYGTIAIDNNGNLLIADAGNNVIRRVDQNGIITTVAGIGKSSGYSGDGGPATSAKLHTPYGVGTDRSGNIYIADNANYRIRKVDTNGVITTFAGNGTKGDSGDGGPAVNATINSSAGLWVDLAGSVYFAEYGGDVIRMVDTTGNIHTIAGTPGASGSSGDGGPATSAKLNTPHSVMGDNLGNLYIDDEANHSVRKVDAAGIIDTIAGNGKGYAGDGGPASAAKFNYPYSVVPDSANNLYVADQDNYRIRLLSLNTGFSATAVGASSTQNVFVQSSSNLTLNTAVVTPASPAEFTLNALSGCTLGASLNANTPCTAPVTFQPTAPGFQMARLAFTDASGNVSAIGLTGIGVAPEVAFSVGPITTVGGTGVAGNDGTSGLAVSAQVSSPRGGFIDSAGNIYFADSGNSLIRKIDSVSGAISTIAGTGTPGYSGDGGAATAAQLNMPAKLVVDAAGDLYIADRGNNVIRYVDVNTGFISTIAGNGTAGYAGDGGPATSAELNHPQGIAVDQGGHIYVADTGNNVIRFFGKGSMIATLTGTGTAGYSGDGGNAFGAALNAPQAVTLGIAGNIYIADTGNDVVRVISASNQISTVAGQQGDAVNAGDGGAATNATLNQPSDIALDAAGDIYIASGGQVRLVNTSGIINTVAGTGATGSYSGEGGTATSAVIPSPASNLMLNNDGDIVLADTAGDRLLKVAAGTPATLNLGTQTPGTTGAAQIISILNTGNSALNISGISVSANFTQQPAGFTDCTATTVLGPGQACSIGVAFSPGNNTSGVLSGTLTLTDNTLNGTGVTQAIPLSGTAKLVAATTTLVGVVPVSLVYGSPATITATVNGGVSPTGMMSFSVNGVSIGTASVNAARQASIALPLLSAGGATISASYQGDASNGSSSGTANITIQPAMLTVTAANASMSQGAPLPSFTYTVTGLVNGDASSLVTGVPVETTTATTASLTGTYPITITQGTLSAANYAFTFVSGTLTIEPPLVLDYSLSVTPTAISIPVGQIATATVTLNPINGYQGTVQLSCASPSNNVSCAFENQLTADGKGDPASTVVRIAVGGNSLSSQIPNQTRFQQHLWLSLGMPFCIFGIAAGSGRKRRWPRRMLGIGLLAVFTLAATSCSSNMNAGTTSTGSYQVVVTASDSSAHLSHAVTITLTALSNPN